MAIIPQIPLFSWNEVEALGDLDRLRLALEYSASPNSRSPIQNGGSHCEAVANHHDPTRQFRRRSVNLS